jgi:uncharacterized protein YjbJ (UPF0337 family)
MLYVAITPSAVTAEGSAKRGIASAQPGYPGRARKRFPIPDAIRARRLYADRAEQLRRLRVVGSVTQEVFMDREHIKGAADKARGAIKDTAGKLTGDKKMQSEGKFDKAKGSAHNVAGDVKDAVRDVSKSAKD